jgi:hypothetical protein
MSKHTPGPWQAVSHYSDELSVIDSKGFGVVEANRMPILLNYSEILGIDHWADMPDVAFRELGDEELDANARLIAAAPELLEALKMVSGYIYTMKGAGHEYTAAVQAAIAKAEGAQ